MKELPWLLQEHPDQPAYTLQPGLIPGNNDQLSLYDAQKPQIVLRVHCESWCLREKKSESNPVNSKAYTAAAESR